MALANGHQAADLSPKMLSFTVTKATTTGLVRIGRLMLPGRKPIDTPHYIGSSSRGVVPHISPDNLRARTNIQGAYLALEDFIERAPGNVPILNYHSTNDESPLRSFCAWPSDALLILGPRRAPPVPCLKANSNAGVSVWTSFGSSLLEGQAYSKAVWHLRPDIAVGMGDILFDQHSPSRTRLEKMGDRSEAWLKLLCADGQNKTRSHATPPYLFAPVLPISRALQARYLEAVEDLAGTGDVEGLAIYDAASLVNIPAPLSSLPRLGLTHISGPHALLREIQAGIDIFTIPFVGTATDAGIALDFEFGVPSNATDSETPLPLGLDMWRTEYATDLSPVSSRCTCYACTNHHRAYLQHLFSAKEMLGWVLLQIHNHHVADAFFAAVRASISSGTFGHDKAAFEARYETELPVTNGQKPRARGYQFKSEGPGEAKKNPRAYNTLDDTREKLAEAAEPGPDVTAADLENAGLGRSAS